MKWNKYTIETTTAAEDYMSAMLADLGIEGVEIEDNIPLSQGRSGGYVHRFSAGASAG